MAANHHGVLHEEDDSEDGHHVHFPEDISANTEIQIQMKGDSIANVHLGFLQHRHKYEIQLNIPIFPASTSLTPIINTPFIAVGNVNSPGKPMLKEGIRCIYHEKDEEEDHSDWQGFD